MTDRPRPGAGPEERASPPSDDAALGALVRQAAEDWRMPPQGIEQRTWRDRISDPPGRGDGIRRFAAAGALAVAATIVVAVGAIWLRQASEPPIAGASATPSESSRPPVTAEPSPSGSAASPLPTFATAGGPIGVPAVLVRDGGYRAVDLTTGALGPTLGQWPRQDAARFFGRPDGGWWCVCYPGERALRATTATVAVVAYDAAGAVVSTTTVGTYGPGLDDPDLLGFLPFTVSVGPAAEPGRAFVGWAVRTADGWTSGVDLLDLASGRIVTTLRLPDLPLALDSPDGLRPTWVDAPRVTAAPGGASIVASQTPSIILERDGFGDLERLAPDRWYAAIEADRFSPASAFRTGQGTLDPTWCPNPYGEAFADATIFVAVCPSEGIVRRVDVRGSPVGDVAIPGLRQDSFAPHADFDGRRYVWLPFERTLHAVDLVAGTLVGSLDVGTTAALLHQDPLSGLARRLADWLAPPATAKIFLDPAIAISPDGRRLYLATVTGDGIESPGGSAGIVVVDTATLTVVDRWEPLADITSIAVGRDGFVYATGAPGVDAAGHASPDRQASLVVHEAADGSVRVIAGQLGPDYLTLDPLTMP